MVRKAAFLQRSDPLDVGEVQAPDADRQILLLLFTAPSNPQNAFTSDSEEQGVFFYPEGECRPDSW